YRARFDSTPDTLTNAILLGSLLVPLGILLGSGRPKDPLPTLGALPLARRDVERLRQLLGLQRRLRDAAGSPRAQRALAHRSIFPEALTWFDIHGGDRDVIENWMRVLAQAPVEGEDLPVEIPELGTRRRRRRRRRRRPAGPVQS